MTSSRHDGGGNDQPLTEEDGWVSPDPELDDLLDHLYAESHPGPEPDGDDGEFDWDAMMAVARAMAEADDRAAVHSDAMAHADRRPIVLEIPKGHRNVRWGVVGGLAAAAVMAGIAIVIGIGSTGGSGTSASPFPGTQSADPTSSAPEIVDVDSPNNSDGRPTLTTVTLDDGTVIDVYEDDDLGSDHAGSLVENTSAVVYGTETNCSVYVAIDDDTGEPVDGVYLVSLDGGATYHEAVRRD